jgi:capsular polysaccharide biosynthesis protein
LKIISLEDVYENLTDHITFFGDNTKNGWIEILPEQNVICRPPLNLEANYESSLFVNSLIPHLYNLNHRAGPVMLATLSNISLVTPHGLMIDADHQLIAESYHNKSMVDIPLREVKNMLSQDSLLDGPTMRIEGPAVLLLGPWSWIYHHWIIEALTRLWVLDVFPDLAKLPVVVPANLTSFQLASLLAMGIKKDQLLLFDGSNWLFTNLYVPSFMAPGGHSRPQMKWLKEKLFTAFGIEEKKAGTRRLYISRGDVATRNIINEQELISVLKSWDFEIIMPGNLPLPEQVELFSEAAIICGTSGSGMTNHIFAPRQATLIEMQPDSYINRAHWFSSNLCDQNYYFLIGHAVSAHHDYCVALGKLEHVIKMSLK